MSTNKIPPIALGLWKMTDETAFNEAFVAAIEAGYTHFDTAQIYGNEDMMGRAWKGNDVSRESLFITTKISIANFGLKRALRSFDDSLKNLQTEYVDLLLLHFPVSLLRKNTWKAAEEIYEKGQAKMIGVSNYTVRHLKEMKDYAQIKPAVNQVELHVFLQQPELVEYCQKEGIILEAYSPLAHGRGMDNEVLLSIAKKHNVSAAQVMLRWCVEKEFVILPKSSHAKRIHENMKTFDFKLDSDDMKMIQSLDKNMRTCWDPTLVP